ncbi:SagB family peptide dehydrogenase [Williamsia sp. 1135]|uniref:SagB family peptide dehydrogenase n=1 Tax=Williamsia sp. 1135 TaxID=1889262 RepID=UPI001F0AA70C|nr:SagB family peptide dehydrogenase [Williamsia sp. 1135]
MTAAPVTGRELAYAFRAGASAMTAPGGVAVLLPAKQRMTGLTPAQMQTLKALGRGRPALSELPGAGADPAVTGILDDLVGRGLLTVTMRWAGTDLYTLRPFDSPPPRPPVSPDSTVVGQLSKFAVIHRVDGRCVAEHPLSWCDIEIHDAGMLAVLTGLPGVDPPAPQVVAELARDLTWAGFTAQDDAEESEFATRSWGAHELWFHRKSTFGVRAKDWGRFGPTKWAAGSYPPLPARKPEYPGPAVALKDVDLDELRVTGDALTSAIEDRASCRDFDTESTPTLDQLGEFLYRTHRNRELRVIGAEEFPSRPYPSGGGLYELEVYPVVRECQGLPTGMYHYDSFDHVLRPVTGIDNPAIDRLLTPSSLTLSGGQLPQILFVFAARVGRIMWTYEQIPYAVMLKHVGVLTQTMSLVATDMGLGTVAQGYCDTAAFAELAGVDELTECALGSLVLGTPKR